MYNNADTVSPVRIEIWKENNFHFFFIIFEIFIFVLLFSFFSSPHHIFMVYNENEVDNEVLSSYDLR